MAAQNDVMAIWVVSSVVAISWINIHLFHRIIMSETQKLLDARHSHHYRRRHHWFII